MLSIKNGYCQLGHGDSEDRTEPTFVEEMEEQWIIKAACGGWHTLLLSSTDPLYSPKSFITGAGRVFSCGWGESGQLGHGDSTGRDIPTVIKALLRIPIVDVACGTRHSAFVSGQTISNCVTSGSIRGVVHVR